MAANQTPVDDDSGPGASKSGTDARVAALIKAKDDEITRLMNKLAIKENDPKNAPDLREEKVGEKTKREASGRLSTEQIKDLMEENKGEADVPRPFIRFSKFPTDIIKACQDKQITFEMVERSDGRYHVHIHEEKLFRQDVSYILRRYKREQDGYYGKK